MRRRSMLAIIPNIAAWGKLLIDSALGAAGTNVAAVGLDKLGQVGVLYHGLEVLAGGAILVGMVLGAIGAFVVDKRIRRGFGFRRRRRGPHLLRLHARRGGRLRGQPAVATAYALVATLLFALSRVPATADAPVPVHAADAVPSRPSHRCHDLRNINEAGSQPASFSFCLCSTCSRCGWVQIGTMWQADPTPLLTTPVIPVLTIERLEDAVPLARALVAGGLPVIEVTLRTRLRWRRCARSSPRCPTWSPVSAP